MDEAERIRLATGKFVSPNTQENQDYLEHEARIHLENVAICDLTLEEITELFQDCPGLEYMSLASTFPFDETLSEIDKALIISRVAATMSAYGLTEIQQVIDLLSGVKKYIPLKKKKEASPSLISQFHKQFGSRLRQMTPIIARLLEEHPIESESEKLLDRVKMVLSDQNVEVDLIEDVLAFLEQSK